MASLRICQRRVCGAEPAHGQLFAELPLLLLQLRVRAESARLLAFISQCLTTFAERQLCTLSALFGFLVFVVMMVIHFQCLAAEHRKTSARKSRRELNCHIVTCRRWFSKLIWTVGLCTTSCCRRTWTTRSAALSTTGSSTTCVRLIVLRRRLCALRPLHPTYLRLRTPHKFKRSDVCAPTNRSFTSSSSSVCKQDGLVPETGGSKRKPLL